MNYIRVVILLITLPILFLTVTGRIHGPLPTWFYDIWLGSSLFSLFWYELGLACGFIKKT